MVRANAIKDATLVEFSRRMADVVIEPDVGLCGDARTLLERLMRVVEPMERPAWHRELARIRAEDQAHDITTHPDDGRLYGPQVMAALDRHTGDAASMIRSHIDGFSLVA